MKHYNIKITGRVQGVFFRDSTKQKALKLGVKGFVKNEPDGSVYLEAEGSVDDLKKMEDWCWQGPQHADVKTVVVEEGELKNFKIFEVRH